jgi:hypothetical protein
MKSSNFFFFLLYQIINFSFPITSSAKQICRPENASSKKSRHKMKHKENYYRNILRFSGLLSSLLFHKNLITFERLFWWTNSPGNWWKEGQSSSCLNITKALYRSLFESLGNFDWTFTHRKISPFISQYYSEK